MLEHGYADTLDSIVYKKSDVVNNEGFYEVWANWNGEIRYIVVVTRKRVGITGNEDKGSSTCPNLRKSLGRDSSPQGTNCKYLVGQGT